MKVPEGMTVENISPGDVVLYNKMQGRGTSRQADLYSGRVTAEEAAGQAAGPRKGSAIWRVSYGGISRDIAAPPDRLGLMKVWDSVLQVKRDADLD